MFLTCELNESESKFSLIYQKISRLVFVLWSSNSREFSEFMHKILSNYSKTQFLFSPKVKVRQT